MAARRILINENFNGRADIRSAAQRRRGVVRGAARRNIPLHAPDIIFNRRDGRDGGAASARSEARKIRSRAVIPRATMLPAAVSVPPSASVPDRSATTNSPVPLATALPTVVPSI